MSYFTASEFDGIKHNRVAVFGNTVVPCVFEERSKKLLSEMHDLPSEERRIGYSFIKHVEGMNCIIEDDYSGTRVTVYSQHYGSLKDPIMVATTSRHIEHINIAKNLRKFLNLACIAM